MCSVFRAEYQPPEAALVHPSVSSPGIYASAIMLLRYINGLSSEYRPGSCISYRDPAVVLVA